MLEVRDLTVRFGTITVVDKLSFSVEAGEWLMLVGPNGAGKSTVVNAISNAVPFSGEVLIGGKSVKKYRASELAKRLGVLSQAHSVGYSFSVGEVVRLGRYAHSKGFFSAPDPENERLVQAALTDTGLKEIEQQSVLTLSGGELQRTFLAQVFAQNPSLLVLDEPSNHLDLVYQKQIFELISEWLKGGNRAVISVVHDLDLARCYGTKTLLLNGGRAVAEGKTEAVLSRDNLKEVYSIDVFSWMQERLKRWSD